MILNCNKPSNVGSSMIGVTGNSMQEEWKRALYHNL